MRYRGRLRHGPAAEYGTAVVVLAAVALDEVLGVEEPAKLLIEFGERRRFGLIWITPIRYASSAPQWSPVSM